MPTLHLFVRSLTCGALVALSAAVPAQSKKTAIDPTRPPEVGTIAPPLSQIPWIQFDEATGGKAPDLQALRGKVVIITTYGYYCDSCIRVGVPTANALRAANPDELRLVGITVAVGGDTPEKIGAEAKRLGIQNAVGQAGANGETTPYLNLGVSPSLTFAFVITRTGGVLWKGDPSREREAYLDAVARAIHAIPAEPLPTSMAPELAAAVRAYVMGDFNAVEPATQAALKKVGSKPGAENDRARKDGAALLALVETTRKNLMDELERSVGEDQAERYQRAVERVRRAFPKGPCANRSNELEMVMCIQRPHGPLCKQWSEWLALEAARPATFPVEKDKANSKYAKDLAKYVKVPDLPGSEKARAWLRDFELAVERK